MRRNFGRHLLEVVSKGAEVVPLGTLEIQKDDISREGKGVESELRSIGQGIDIYESLGNGGVGRGG
jgi:hypothetical protein